MTLTSTNSWYEADAFDRHDAVDVELIALQKAVSEARRQSWIDPDPIEPELENFLAALTRPAPEGTHRFLPDYAVRTSHNSWREALEDVS